MFANIYFYLPHIFAFGENRHVVECDNLRFQPEIICNDICEEMFVNIYLYSTPYFLKWWHAACC